MALTTKDGRALTDTEIDALAAEAERGFAPASLRPRPGRPGRPRLDAASLEHSPRITVRVPASLRDRAAARAAAEGRTISQVLRTLLEAYADDEETPSSNG
jgi:hypothetical protein